MDEPGTVFYLVPQNNAAENIVQDLANHERMRRDPDDPSKRFLRVGLEQLSKTPGYLVKFGRTPCTNDVILSKGWSKIDQCYFDFHKTTGELLLHDISKRGNTRLWGEKMPEQIWKNPRQCVVLLNCQWNFAIGSAEFRLLPRKAKDQVAFTEERLSFVRQPVPEDYEGTYEGTIEKLSTFGLQSCGSSRYNTRLNTPHQPTPGNEIRYTKLKPLGKGSQGSVYKVVDMYTGEYYACKIIQPREIPQWGIHTEKAFREKIENEVNLLKKKSHDYIVPYVWTQGWKIGQDIEIFMDIYEGSLEMKIKDFKSKEERQTVTMSMFRQISLALDYIHRGEPQIIHRDIKPPNILYRGENFYLTDFGIAKAVDSSRTLVGTGDYIAPEVRMGSDQTTKVDIYSLGVTMMECFGEFPERAKWPPTWQLWHQYLQSYAGESRIASMLATNPNERPTASELTKYPFLYSFHASSHSPRNNIAPLSFVSSSTLSQMNGATLTHSPPASPMEWTRTGSTEHLRNISQPTPRDDNVEALQPTKVAGQHTLPRKIPSERQTRSDITRSSSVKPRNEGQKESQTHNGSSLNERHARSKSIGMPKRTASSRRAHSRSKYFLAKTQETIDMGTI